MIAAQMKERGQSDPPLVLPLDRVGADQAPAVGGKAAQLGELSHVEGVLVPPGFCVTTDAFRQALAAAPETGERIAALARADPADRAALSTLSAAVRRAIEAAPMPASLVGEITRLIAAQGEQTAWAVRSSATAEDLPRASFAGQHDTYLNVSGASDVLRSIRGCWASLFSERAVAYRAASGVDDTGAAMAVVVQRLLDPQAAGILFTADPVTSNRSVAYVEAVFGMGDAVVSGRVEADSYRVRDGRVLSASTRTTRVLTDAQVLRLVEIGRRIESHFERALDIEWCLVQGAFHIVQSRPITTLFPVPAATDGGFHVYVSVGHGQMMTDAMRPLGISVWRHTALIPMHEAGSRLFVDVTGRLASPATRAVTLDVFGRGDPLMRDALETVLAEDVLPLSTGDAPGASAPTTPPAEIEADPALVAELVQRSRESVEALRGDIRGRSGAALLEFISADFEELKRVLSDRRSSQAVMAGMGALEWLNENLEAWLGEKGAGDTLMLAAPGNVTSEMGRALLDVADAVRPHAEIVELLEGATGDAFLDELGELPGGGEARDAILAFLDQYGMRCVGEIDITRPRWAEHPVALVPLILANVRNFEPGAARRQLERGLLEAGRKEHEVLDRLGALPGGHEKAREAKRMIDRLRTFIGYREYPKYAIVCRHAIYKQALLGEADRLVDAGVLRDREDIFYLSLEELREVVDARRCDETLIARRRQALIAHGRLQLPRVLTSEGEALLGSYRRGDLPAGALAGLPASAGVAEGPARVVRDIADADLRPGDILVTVSTDPSWSPAFLSVGAMVTEVGGLMTHGAVIAREYGLPAVVGVAEATQLIGDGELIRVNGTEGHVEVLSRSRPPPA